MLSNGGRKHEATQTVTNSDILRAYVKEGA